LSRDLFSQDLTAEEFVEIIEENAAEIEELVAEGGLDIEDLEDAIEEIETSVISSSDESESPIESETSGESKSSSDHSVHRFGFRCLHWLNLLMLKLCMMII
jgi:hypothetical protein